MVTQLFREYGKCIFVGKCAKPKQVGDNQAESSRCKHVTRARSWWKRGETNMREAWEHEGSKDEMNIVLQGLEQHFWKGTKAGWMGCYDFPGETWAGDGSANKGVMGAGSVCFQRPSRNLAVRMGREEGVSSLRLELAAIARTLQATSVDVDLLYLCDSEAALNKASRWIGSGPRPALAGDANADIMTSTIECVRERLLRGARTFMIKVKAHRGEPLHERADTQAENARQPPSECRQWTTRTQIMTYEWSDNNGVKHVTAKFPSQCLIGHNTMLIK
jgi:ribonuclease HI